MHNILYKIFLFLFLFFSMLLLCSFFTLKELFQVKKWFNYVVNFFLKMPKIWVGRRKKKQTGWPKTLRVQQLMFFSSSLSPSSFYFPFHYLSSCDFQFGHLGRKKTCLLTLFQSNSCEFFTYVFKNLARSICNREHSQNLKFFNQH